MQLYQIGKLIGTGAFGDVFVCMHRQDRKRYAAKRLNLAQRDERGKQNIENQLKMLQKFRHPNIVPFKDSFLTEKGLYIIMVYCQGGDMYSRIRNIKEKGKIFTQSQILDWFVQALAIHYLHSKRIVHRDLKSQNLFLKIQQNQKGQRIERIRLGDFGIAKVLDQNQDLTATSTGIGSPLYMSPQALDKNVYSYKSDIWSLGCIIYQLCNLRTPFDAQSHFGLIRKVLHSTYPTISPTYSKQLRDLISQMLEKKAVNRPSIIQILNKPFIKARAQKYIRDTLLRVDKSLDIDDIFMDSLRQQAKNLEVPLHQQNTFIYPSRASIGDNQSFSNSTNHDDNWAFIDNKKKQMMADNMVYINNQMKHNQIKEAKRQQIEQQKNNLKTFKFVQDYSMEQAQKIQQSFASIIEEEDQFQQTYQHSVTLDIQESQVYSKQHTFLKVFNQIQILKNTCQTGLGMHKFLKAYHLTEQGTNRQAMVQILGEDQIGYWHLIEQALFYQSILKSSQKNDIQ